MRNGHLAILLLACAAPALAASSAADDALLHGQVVIKSSGEHAIHVVVTDSGAPAAGKVHLFRFWSESAVPHIDATLNNADVEFRARELYVVASAEHRFYSFVLSDAECSRPVAPESFTAVRAVGYGLNHEIRPAACASQSVDCYFERDPD